MSRAPPRDKSFISQGNNNQPKQDEDIMKSIIEFAKDKPVETSMKMSWTLVEAIDSQKDQQTPLADKTGFTVMWTDGDIQVATNGLNAVISSPDALRLAADLREMAVDGGAFEVFHEKKTEVKPVITFTGSLGDIAEDQMRLSASLAEAIGTLEDVHCEFVDGLGFDVFWDKGIINFELGATTFQMTQPEALEQASLFRKAALEGGATVM
ncbi:hypothetical protein KAI46_16275 [bacterium]|nr:hypothetical protein [bacterium]